MKRDMDLVRLIMLEIEEDDSSAPICNLTIEGYNKETVAFHCELLYEVGYISDYNAIKAGGQVCEYGVGPLTWDGYDYLDLIRDNSLWKKTKEAITQKGLPLLFDTIKTIAGAFITAAAEGVANSIIKNGGV